MPWYNSPMPKVRRDVVLLFATRFARMFGYGLVSIILVLYLTRIGFDEKASGLLLSLTLAGDMLISLWMTTRADRIGRRNQLMAGAILIAIFSFSAPFLLDAGGKGQDAYILIGFFVLGLTFGQSSGAVSSRFTQYYRYTGAALTSDLAWLVGAGFAPLVALGLASSFGIVFIGGHLVSGAICTIAALTLSRALDQH